MVVTITVTIWRYMLLTALYYIGIVMFLMQFMLTPLYLVNKTLYKKASSVLLVYLAIPGFLCIPFSWMNCRVYTNGFDRLRQSRGRDQLIISNHIGRIDWVYGLFMGSYYNQRVGFIGEAFLRLLPFVGWHRLLVEDMYVFRSFKRDEERLLKNIESFKQSQVPRWVFLCPEGYIADFNEKDKEYIEECESFCISQEVEPFKMVLTPRYKGMQVFSKLCPTTAEGKAICHQCTTTYVQNGERLVKPLRSLDRVVPDLWSMVHGNLYSYIHLHSFELSTEPLEVKKQMMNVYSLQDKLLYEFYKTGRFPLAYPGKTLEESPDMWKPKPIPNIPYISQDDMDMDTGADSMNLPKRNDSTMQRIEPNHLHMNAVFITQTFGSIFVYIQLGLAAHIPFFFLGLFCVISLSHFLGEKLANGQSRESLPFETVFKAIFLRIKGIES